MPGFLKYQELCQRYPFGRNSELFVDTIKKMGITLKERKKQIIQAIAEHDDWIEDIETVLESLAEKDSHERTEQTWNKYAQPLNDLPA